MKGTLKKEREAPYFNTSLPFDEQTRIGNELLNFFSIIEVVLHEFSHALNYEQIMDETNWTKLDIPRHNPNYFLWDEFFAKYRSVLVGLKMLNALLPEDGKFDHQTE